MTTKLNSFYIETNPIAALIGLSMLYRTEKINKTKLLALSKQIRTGSVLLTTRDKRREITGQTHRSLGVVYGTLSEFIMYHAKGNIEVSDVMLAIHLMYIDKTNRFKSVMLNQFVLSLIPNLSEYDMEHIKNYGTVKLANKITDGHFRLGEVDYGSYCCEDCDGPKEYVMKRYYFNKINHLKEVYRKNVVQYKFKLP